MNSEPVTGVRVMVVEDHELLAESLRIALSALGMSVTLPDLRPDAILAAATPRHDVVLLDLDLGDSGLDGSSLVEGLAATGARVVVVSGTEDRHRIAACVRRGAHGYVAKSRPLDELVDAVLAAAAGQPILAEIDRQELLRGLRSFDAARQRELLPFESLTSREGYVLAQLMAGRPAATIAGSSYVSEATVRTQIRAILTKLGVRSQLAAVAEARRIGWVPQAASTQLTVGA
jgi:DNA-binding NarL/FixJ family response regulator